MNVPDSYVEEGTKLAEGMLVFGKPVGELTREELIACLAHHANSLRLQREADRRLCGLFPVHGRAHDA